MVTGVSPNIMETSSKEAVHVPLAIVQRITYVPYTDAVAVDVAEFASENAIVPGPDTNVQVPVPTVGVFPARVAAKVPQTL